MVILLSDTKTEVTYINQTKVVFIYGELFWSNLLLQSWGIGALKNKSTRVIISGSYAHCKLLPEKNLSC